MLLLSPSSLKDNKAFDNLSAPTFSKCLNRLTPKECERLQGFPDDWTKYGEDGKIISDTQRYKCLGNAVTTNVISAIGNRLKNISNS